MDCREIWYSRYPCSPQRTRPIDFGDPSTLGLLLRSAAEHINVCVCHLSSVKWKKSTVDSKHKQIHKESVSQSLNWALPRENLNPCLQYRVWKRNRDWPLAQKMLKIRARQNNTNKSGGGMLLGCCGRRTRAMTRGETTIKCLIGNCKMQSAVVRPLPTAAPTVSYPLVFLACLHSAIKHNKWM